jgi:hypothetical protein
MARLTFSLITFDKHGDEVELHLPAKFILCSRCQGAGTHTNPSIDGNGITGSEWAEWDDEDRETYMSGGYDVTCETCKGERVVQVPDLERCTFAQKRALVRKRREEREYQRDYDSERWLRMAESGERY